MHAPPLILMRKHPQVRPWQRRLASRDALLLDSTVGSLSESELCTPPTYLGIFLTAT